MITPCWTTRAIHAAALGLAYAMPDATEDELLHHVQLRGDPEEVAQQAHRILTTPKWDQRIGPWGELERALREARRA